LVMDSDRDGTIASNDLARVDESHPYRFWVNCDADDNNGEKYDLPESVTPVPVNFYRKKNYFADVPGQNIDVADSPDSIGTLNDLEDFFPALIQWPENVSSNSTCKIFANVKIGIVDAGLESEQSGSYLTDLTVATNVLGMLVHVIDPSNEETVFTNEPNKVILIEAHEEHTNAQIYVEFEEPDGEILTFTNYFSFTSAEKMFRFKNLREEDEAAAPDRLDPPENWPDDLCNDANYYYVHGFNVSEPRGRGAQANMFKRLFWSGSNARFYGVCWDGSPLTVPAMPTKRACHYHNAVVNAFATAPHLATFLNSQTAGERQNIIMAHSLGNILTSSAICDHDANVKQYYMVDAAVAKEAYGDTTPNPDMIPDGSLIFNQNEGIFSVVGHNWHDYPFETYPSEYYQLFDSSDDRSKLTWRHRFADIQTKTEAFNFYSSTEDVLRVDTGYTTSMAGLIDWDLFDVDENKSLYVFQTQEMYKGKNDFSAIIAGGGSDPFAGWGFTTESDLHIQKLRINKINLEIELWPKYPSYQGEELDQTNESRRNEFREKLKSDPLFRPEPEILFGDNGASFAAGVVGDYEHIFNYDGQTGNLFEYLPGIGHKVPIDIPMYGDLESSMDVSNVTVRDYLLAKAFPARTGALGSRSNNIQVWRDVNFDMHSLYMNDPAEWPTKAGNNPEWRHSAIRDLPYAHNYKFFDEVTGKERN
jgi:hypothetical protein